MELPRKLYLAGPMAGLPDHNFPIFNRVAAQLRERGHVVFNPAENDDGGIRRARSFYMKLDIPALLASDAIVLLDGWQRSRGASLEVWLALDMGMPIFRVEAHGEIEISHFEHLSLAELPRWTVEPTSR